MNYYEQACTILAELVCKHYPTAPPHFTCEALLWPSCGLMGDERIYGYAWSIGGIVDFDMPESRAFLREAGHRLTAEVVHDDGTRFVRVLAELAAAPGG